MFMSTIAVEETMESFLAGLQWHGFPRADGRVGARNYRIVLSTVALTDRLAAQIASTDPAAVLVSGGFSRGLQQQDEAVVEAFIRSVLHHPNVGAALVLAHDRKTAERLQQMARADMPLRVLAFMACNGRGDALESGTRALAELAAMAPPERQPQPFSAVSVGLECGGSDVSSSLCTNPLIGEICDLLVAAGGMAVVSETAEFIGAEAVVEQRCADAAVRSCILGYIRRSEQLMQQDSGKDYRGTNPTEENIEGGLTTLIEKSMGAVSKTGTTDFVSGIAFGETPALPGLHFMDTPFFSPASLTGMMMAGCTLSLFAMGVFNPSGNPLCPTIKLCGNPRTIAAWKDQIDISLEEYFLGAVSRQQAMEEMLRAINSIFNGRASAAELAGEGQFILPRGGPAL